MEQLDSVIIAGQFGAHLPVESLIGIGLLPEQLREKLRYVGNSSQTGAAMALLSEEKRLEMEELAQKIDYIELAQTEVLLKERMKILKEEQKAAKSL